MSEAPRVYPAVMIIKAISPNQVLYRNVAVKMSESQDTLLLFEADGTLRASFRDWYEIEMITDLNDVRLRQPVQAAAQ